MFVRVELFLCICVSVNLFFLIFSLHLWIFYLLQICIERLCESLRRVWFPCVVVQKPSETGFIIGVEFEKQDSNIILILLELSGFDELIGFKSCVEEECCDIDEAKLWYGRRIQSKMMGFEEKISLMTATMVGSKGLLSYILETSCVDVNQACDLDGLLHFVLLLLWIFLLQLRLLSSCLMLLHFICLVAYCWLCIVKLVHFILAISLLYSSNCI